MRIEYTIYWFEDKNSWLTERTTIQGILDFSEYLKNHGFEINIIFFVEQSLSNTRDFMLKEFLDKYPEKYKIRKLDNYRDDNLKKIDFFNVDLVLMDYNLGSEKGNDVINYIRDDQNDVYTDILFYSENESEKGLRKKSDRDGLYCSGRSELFSGDKIKKVIKTTIRKTQDLNNLRGLVMAETSELDEMVKEILKLVVEKDKVEENKIMERGPKLKKTHIDRIKIIEGYIFPRQFEEFVELRCFEAGFSLRTLKSFAKCDKNSLIRNEIEPYEGLQKEKNNLAHIPEDLSTPILMKIKGVKYDEQKFVDIRKDIQKYKKLFQEIINDLNS